MKGPTGFSRAGLPLDVQLIGSDFMNPERTMDGTAPENAASAQEKIQEMVRRIVERFHPHKIILFGSYARGTAGPDSDVDLLVVMQVSGSKRRQAIEIDMAVAGIGLPKDVIVVTPEEVERDKDLVGTIIRPALREGKVLYERTL